MALFDARPTGDQVAGSIPQVWLHSFVDIDNEVFLRSFSQFR